MKRSILFAIVAAMLSFNVHADWDAAGEAREAAARKAEQQRAAAKNAAHDKIIREESAKAYRQGLGKDAIGKSDAEVERIYKQRQADAVNQAASVNAAVAASGGKQKKGGAASDYEQGDAAMKAMYGKSVNDIGNMSEKEREAFFRELEKKYPK
jgi:hypothetical protein